jgi:hypothetical protein
MVLKVYDLLISALLLLLADFIGYPPYLTATHRHFSQISQGFGSVLE